MTMAGYDGLTTGSQPTPLDIMHMGVSSDIHCLPVNDGLTNGLDFNAEALFNDMQQLYPPTYDLDHFTTTFDEPSSYHTNVFDTFFEDNANNADSQPVDLDNKLLGFGPPIHKIALLDQTGQTWPRMSAELNGMFSVAEDVFEGDSAGTPLELTCYRRNLFQISGTLILSRSARHVLLDQIRQIGIYDLSANLSAVESIEGKATDIIAVPWKSGGVNGAQTFEEKTGSSPADIPVDLNSNQEVDPMFLSVQVAWARLQFKYATANNGRRKGLQQHYRIIITLTAKMEGDGSVVKIAEIISNPIVVRGRSPKNFDSSKDVPLSERKGESAARARTGSNVVSTPQWIEPALLQSQTPSFYAANIVQPISSPIITTPSKKSSLISPTSQKRRPPVPQPHWELEPSDHNTAPLSMTHKPPLGLSLCDDDISTPSTFNDSISLPNGLPPGKRTQRPSVTSPPDSADSLYEYFPLSLDDWMPPVDAIYRPHVVHHLKLPPEIQAQQIRTKPKRYFSADD